jgi:hypothetical protein
MRLGGGVHFDLSRDLKDLDSVLIREKVGRACISIWSRQVFDAWDNALDGNVDKRMSNYLLEFQEATTSKDRPARKILGGMLQKWSSGAVETDEINSAKYEAFIKFAIEQGKLSFEDKFYYLIMGFTTRNKYGEPLISQAAIKRMERLFDLIPELEIFDDGSGYKKDGRLYPPEMAEAVGAEKRLWTYEDYLIWANRIKEPGSFEPGEKTKAFIMDVVEESEIVQSRHERMSRSEQVKKMDHDDAPSRFAGLSLGVLKAWIANDSGGGNKITPDAWRGLLHGATLWFDQKYKHIDRMDKEFPLGHPHHAVWQQAREAQLKKVAGKMRVAFTLSQSLKNNFTFEKMGKASYTFTSKDEYERMSYGYCAHKDGDQVENFVEAVMEENGLYDENSEFRRLTRERGYEVASDRAPEDLDKLNTELIKEPMQEKYVSGNTEVVWKLLKEKFGGGASSSGDAIIKLAA